MDFGLNITENSYIIRFGLNEKVLKEEKSLSDCWEEYFQFIHSSHQQMSDIFNDYNDDNESRILKTPSRKSNRKRSSVRTQLKANSSTRRLSKRKVSSAFSTRELFPTPRQSIKNGKNEEIIGINDKSIRLIDFGSDDHQKDVKSEPINEINTPLELFSELSLKETENKVENIEEKENEIKSKIDVKVDKNESDIEWMTDDEECDQKMETEEFFDANEEQREKNAVKRKMDTSIDLKKIIPNSTSKPKKKKKSQYFTPKTSICGSSRAKTRMQSRIVNSIRSETETTPQMANNSNSKLNSGSKITRQMEVNITSSGESNSQKYGSSSRSMRYVSRINKQSDTKTLTASAAKRRQEEDEKRRLRLEAAQEKEKKVLENRQQLLEQKVSEKKMKSQQKFNRAAEQRELQRLKEEEKFRKEKEKREELEKLKLKKLEEERRVLLQKRRDEIAKRAQENERRKLLLEFNEEKIKFQKQEEHERKQELEKERLEEQERMNAIIKQHNNSLQQKAVAQSFLKKCDNNLNPKLVLHKISPLQIAESETNVKPNVSPNEPLVELKSNKTFVVEKDESKSCETSVYDMTPPPVEHNYDNYDISEIKSDDDTDDECKPRKPIPSWARGSQFCDILKQQYAKSYKSRERVIRTVFSNGIKFPVELGLIFGAQRSVAAKYSKRTSSAVWNSPPNLNTNISLNSTQSETSFRNKN